MVSENNSNSLVDKLEVATTTAFTVGITPAAALHELNTGNYISLPAIENIPGIDHASSALGSFVVGAGITQLMEIQAQRLDNKGNSMGAERVRRWNVATAFMGSLAAQLAVEMNPAMGVGDKWDVVAGLISTVPGIMAARVAIKQEIVKAK